MRIVSKSAHKSIDGFQSIDIPQFTVFTGLNGSGKSHLLSAIQSGAVVLEPLADPKIVLFTPAEFMVDNQGAISAHQIEGEIEAGWRFLASSPFDANLRAWNASLKGHPNPHAESDTPFFDTLDDGLKRRITAFFKGAQMQSREAQSVFMMIESLPMWIGNLSKERFSELYRPKSLKKDFLPNELGRIIWDYYLKLRSNQLNEFLSVKHGKIYPHLTDSEFFDRNGPKPWDLLSEILKSFDSLRFEIKSPEGLADHGNYKLELARADNGLPVEFGALSSGEKVLMAMVASVFKASSDKYFPDVLLLDEVDASLHPSMIKNVLAAISNVFLSRGVKVILVTHSPTTIALAPEEAVYVVSNVDGFKIEKQDRASAISSLTEGFATLDHGMRLFDQVTRTKVNIITEGGNAEILNMAIKLFGIEDVEVVTGLESITGKSQLQNLFKFFSCAGHKNAVLFVWDCDAESEIPRSVGKTLATSIPKNEANQLASSGIENAFPESLFDGFINETRTSGGKLHKVFDKSRKKDFAAKILERRNLGDFEGFSTLMEKIRDIARSSS